VLRQYLTNDAWLQARRQNFAIGASDVSKILGVSAYGSPWSVWLAHHRPAEEDNKTREHFALGHDLEPVTLRAYARRQGIEITHMDHAIYTHPKVDWVQMSPDGISGPTDAPTAHYEAKACMSAAVAGKLPPDEQMPGDDWTVPDWRYQMLWQFAACPTLQTNTLVVLLPWFEVRAYTLHRVDVADEIKDLVWSVAQWRKDTLMPGTPPPPDASSDCKAGIDWLHPAPDDWAKKTDDRPRRDATPEEADLIMRYADARDAEAAAKTQAAALRNQIVPLFGEHYQLNLGDGARATCDARRIIKVKR